MGVGGPIGDYAQFEQHLRSVLVIGGFPSQWTDQQETIMEPATVSQLKAHVFCLP